MEIIGFIVIAGMIVWSVYTTQQSFKVQSENHLIMVRILDRIERMTERLVVRSADEDIQH
jgi:hypothetical protein